MVKELLREIVPDVINQVHLSKVLHLIFPHEDIKSNVRSEIKSIETSSFLELDVWIPNLNLCFEFQDPHHYATSYIYQFPLASIQQRDNAKKEIARAKGLDLLQVNCWWDGNIESLLATINFQRPDLELPHPKFQEISLNPSLVHFKSEVIPDTGELMLASFPVTFDPIDISWWMGEKYDGIRACWNRIRKKLYSRSGNSLSLYAPMFISFFGCSFLDGELWFGRGNFAEAQRVTFDPSASDWSFLRFVVFDEPPPNVVSVPFEERYSHVLNSVPVSSPFIIPASRVLAAPKKEMSVLQFVDWAILQVVDYGGEGVILRKRGSLYEHGRSTSLVKFKSQREDQEALVMDAVDDQLRLKLPTGIEFSIQHLSRTILPKKGEIVTFTHDGISKKGIPVNPNILRIRKDVSWEQICTEARKVQEEAGTKLKREIKERGREVLKDIAKKMKFDPLVPQHWYLVSSKDISSFKEGKKIINKYGGSMIRALSDLFPELPFDKSRFSFLPNHFWKQVENRKEFFVKFSTEKNFDPLSAEKWYSVQYEELAKAKGLGSLLEYEGSIAKALIHLFPDIGLDISKFPTKSNWQETKNRKEWFEKYAKERGFDHLIPSNWYSIPRTEFLSSKGANSILSYYGGSMSKALAHVFPDVAWNSSLFSQKISFPRNHWTGRENQRKIFGDYARQQGFDPLVSSFWYSAPLDSILAFKGVRSILSYHGGSYVKALQSTYPELNLDPTKFSIFPKKYWHSAENRKQFFIDFAHEKGFDPLIASNWQSITSTVLLGSSQKGAKSILHYYCGNLSEALLQNFPNIGLDKHKL